MTNLTIFKHGSLDLLKRRIGDNLPLYEKGEMAALIVPPAYNVREVDSIALARDAGDIALPDAQGENTDVDNSMFVHDMYSALTPLQASDERIWAYAAHVTFAAYVHRRWPLPTVMSEQERKAGKEGEKKFHNRRINHVKAHYFAEGNRGFIRDNAIARLWWMGFIAKRCQLPHEETLNLLLRKSDVRANILERPNLSMSAEIFNEIISLLDDDKDKPDTGDSLFARQNFRAFMRLLNRKGGVRILNALPPDTLNKLLRNIKREAIEKRAAA